jgi:hypothetical protein
MIENIGLLRLQNAWRECERHVHHLSHALTSLTAILPLTGEKFEQLDDEQTQDIDQLILRFTKLQDTMGTRLFPALLEYLEEPYRDRPMLDKLNHLEKLRFIDSVQQWQSIRDIRNRFAHEYPDDPDKNAAHINLACEAAIELFGMLKKIADKLQTEQPMLNLGRSSLPDPMIASVADRFVRYCKQSLGVTPAETDLLQAFMAAVMRFSADSETGKKSGNC